MTFAERLAEILSTRGKTKSDLARFLGIEPQSVGQWGKGIKPTLPRGRRLAKIAEFLGVAQSDLLLPPGSPIPHVALEAPTNPPAGSDPGLSDIVKDAPKLAIVSAWDKLPEEDKAIVLGVLKGLLARRGLPPIDI